MREHPILFSDPMIQALLDGRKSVTRRMSKRWLKVKAGDRLWVRETWAPFGDRAVIFQATNIGYPVKRWKPSIHMPRWASRILLECDEDARVEQLQDITEEDAQCEGVEEVTHSDGVGRCWRTYGSEFISHSATARDSFASLWMTLHTKPGEQWGDNPEVVRVGSFRRIA